MNIFLLTETQSGCYKWRSGIPAKYLSRRGHRVQILSPRQTIYEAPDVLVFYRAHYVEAIRIAQWCKKNSIRVVFDTDDAIDLIPPENIHYADLQPRVPVYEYLLEVADVVTTTTETLARHLRTWNRNVAVVPNSVDPEEWSIAPRRHDGLRIGWTGGSTHFADLAVAFDSIRDLQKKYPFTFVLQGISSNPDVEDFCRTYLKSHGRDLLRTPLGKAIKQFLSKLSHLRYEFHPFVSIAEHSRKVSSLALDIGIAPLVDSTFNSNKSCIKYYEYAMSGAVTIASHALPYSAEVTLTAENTRHAWTQKLEEVVQADRESLWREQRDWVLTNRNIETNVELWEKAFAGEAPRSLPSANADRLIHATT